MADSEQKFWQKWLSKKNAAILVLILAALAILANVVGIVGFIQSVLSPPATHEQVENATKNLSQGNQQTLDACNKAVAGINALLNISNATNSTVCYSQNETSLECNNSPSIVNGSILIDECDSIYKMVNITEGGFRILTSFKPLWGLDDGRTHYLVDVSANCECNEFDRVSLYIENQFLKLRLYDGLNKEYLLKMPMNSSNWNYDDWNYLDFGWYSNDSYVFVSLNSNRVDWKPSNGSLDLMLSNSRIFLGSDMNGKNQADGFFDYLGGGNYYYPETVVTVGPEQHLGS